MNTIRCRAALAASVFVAVLYFFLPQQAGAAITATPKFLFLDGTRKSTPVTINNNGDDEREVWVEAKFGYVTSDDSGNALLQMDSTGDLSTSAAAWIQAFPKRFVLGPGETQIIRLTTTPPPGLADGEYWARVLVTSKPRKGAAAAGSTVQIQNSGLVLQTQIGLPFHFRTGRVNTGVQISDLSSNVSGTDLTVGYHLVRTGNSSFWGTRTLRIIDAGGKIMYTSSKNQIVYKTFNVVERLNQSLPPGEYRIEVEVSTGKRTDIRKEDLLSAAPARGTTTLKIP